MGMLRASAVSVLLLGAVGGSASAAVDITAKWTGWSNTPVAVLSGQAGTYIVDFKRAGVLTGSVTVVINNNNPNPSNRTAVGPAGTASGDTAEVRGKAGSTDTFAANWNQADPQANIAVATHTISPGATATLGAATFAVTGGFSVQGDSLDTASGSPTFGAFSGRLLASGFSFAGSEIGGSNSFSLSLVSDQAFSSDLAPYMNDPLNVAGSTFSSSVQALLSVNGIPVGLVSGLATGQSVYSLDEDGREDYTVSVNFSSTPFGPLSASFSSVGYVEVVPAPGALAVALVSGLLGARRRRNACSA